ncbi:hypothetical protein EZV62_002898 [Acer yangbiense]|uniref:Pentatricopeptide repeat-containing protein n=1 Tax=Acer yangbiense TaxID=1000413 RepID=A0A5C7IYV0_9ROSI|nr:hypothetical protein EZV62_002898 [Acer yangbiense]
MQFMGTLSTPLICLPIQANPESPTVKSDNRNRLMFSLIEQCTSLRHLKQVHAHLLRTGLFFDSYSASKLFTASALSPFSSLENARKVFEEIPEPNLYKWNTLILAYSWSPEPSESVKIFLRMLCESPYFPNKFTFPFLIKAATKLSRLGVGQVFHGLVVKSSFGDDVFILNLLIHFYASEIWISHTREMEAENVKPNAVKMVGVLSACTKIKDLEFGRWIRSYIEQNGIKMDLTLSNAMLGVIDGYAKLGEYDVAKSFLDAIPIQETATWNALISAYDQNRKPQEALAIFCQLQLSKNASPDELLL